HDHVVVANAGHGTEVGAGFGQTKIGTKGADYAGQVLGCNVGLTTEIELTPGIGLQTDSSLTTEHTVALARLTSTEAESVFENEYGLQAITQIFSTLQAPTVGRVKAVEQAGTLGVDVNATNSALNAFVADATVNNTVQRDRGFGLCNTGKASDQSSN